MSKELEETKTNEEEIDRSGIEFRSDADTTINSSDLKNQESSGDEASLVDAMGQNPFVLFLTRTLIKVKNHVSIIPMLFVLATMMIITFTIQVHVQADVVLHNDKMNAFWFFLNVILSLLSVLAYININSKKTDKKKWIIMMVLFYVIIFCSGLIDILYMRDIRIEQNMFNALNKIDDKDNYVVRSYGYTMTHLIFLIVDGVLAALAPIVQPYTRKIQIHKKKH